MAAQDRVEEILYELKQEEAARETDLPDRYGETCPRRRSGEPENRPSDPLDDSSPTSAPAGASSISSHQRPDGDAIGSAVGMALALRALGKQAEVVMDALPPHYLQPFPA